MIATLFPSRGSYSLWKILFDVRQIVAAGFHIAKAAHRVTAHALPGEPPQRRNEHPPRDGGIGGERGGACAGEKPTACRKLHILPRPMPLDVGKGSCRGLIAHAEDGEVAGAEDEPAACV